MGVSDNKKTRGHFQQFEITQGGLLIKKTRGLFYQFEITQGGCCN